MRRGAVCVVTILVATACVSVPTAPPELQAVALTFKPSPGMARIYVYRAGGAFGGASKFSVAIDSQIVGRTAAGTYLMVELAPGPHRVSSPTGENGERRIARCPGGQHLLREAAAQDGILQRAFRHGANGSDRGPDGDRQRAHGAQHLAGHADA